ncbi:MAG: hypothetical protein IJ024_01650 [Lachnospiraceae bacterium]|nr:hypothetical protein [Lachnospiraceae bacterium]
MKKEYEIPMMEVFEFEVADLLMGDSDCPNYSGCYSDCYDISTCFDGVDCFTCPEFSISSIQ